MGIQAAQWPRAGRPTTSASGHLGDLSAWTVVGVAGFLFTLGDSMDTKKQIVGMVGMKELLSIWVG
jgi:hypothetical protein